jgi:hypothetical protein
MVCSVAPASHIRTYKVCHRGERTYTIEIHGILATVTADCLQPAYIIHHDIKDVPPPATPTTTMTHSIR